MAKKKVAEEDNGLKNAAVAIGSALGRLAQKMGLGEAAPPALKVARKRRFTIKSPAPKSKAAPKKTIVTKKVATKPASVKKVKSRTKKM